MHAPNLVQRFIHELMIAPSDAAAAYQKACEAIGHPVPKGLKQAAYKLSHKPAVVAEIARRREARAVRVDVRADLVLQGLLDELKHPKASVFDRVQIYKLLGQHLGMWEGEGGRHVHFHHHGSVQDLPNDELVKIADAG